MLLMLCVLSGCSWFKHHFPAIIAPPAATPTPTPTVTPTPVPDPFCRGGEVFCVTELTPATLARSGLTALGGSLRDGTFQPGPDSGLAATVTLDTSRPFTLTLVSEGGLRTQAKKGFVISIGSTDQRYYLSLQVTTFDNWPPPQLFRGYLAIAPKAGDDPNHYAANLITSSAFGMAYSVADWGNEPHRIAVHVNGAQYQIEIDGQWQSHWAGREGIQPGVKTLHIMFGNSIDPGERFLFVETRIRKVKLEIQP